MSEKALFYNALPNSSYNTGYDRNYDGDDISDFFSAVVETGVVKNTTGLKVTPSSGMVVNVASGKAVIKGKPYRNTSVKTFTVPTAPVGDITRKDAIVLRYDNTTLVRDTFLSYKTGALDNQIPALTRNDTVYEILLAYITVAPSTTTITGSIITDMRGDVTTQVRVKASDDAGTTTLEYNACPYVTTVKGYDDYYDAIVLRSRDKITLQSASATVQFNIPTYNALSDIMSVYTNGILEPTDEYTVSGKVITFTNASQPQKTAGTVIDVVVDKFLDGEGLDTALANYTRLNNEVAALQDINEYNYVCNGATDNVLISNLVKAFIALGNGGSFKLNIYGTFGYTAMAAGAGTSVSPYRFFDFNTAVPNGKVILDFSNCSKITIAPTSGASTVIFETGGVKIVGARIAAENTVNGTSIAVFNSTSPTTIVDCDACYFWIKGYSGSYISYSGKFDNCYGSVVNAYGNSFCFWSTSSSFLSVNGGEYRAYTGTSGAYSGMIYQNTANTIVVLNAVSVPTVAEANLFQTNSIYQTAGECASTYLISILPVVSVSGNNKIWATISISRPNVV